ncbi:hypothetical protein [Paraburkholderia sp. RL17-373-BIF-A]|uniref:hypothetical protein n=1 Tax=Paraburkholderia sp. RL17-373-BIF-A TaxID=3031629 RepID=UPI0038B90F81
MRFEKYKKNSPLTAAGYCMVGLARTDLSHSIEGLSMTQRLSVSQQFSRMMERERELAAIKNVAALERGVLFNALPGSEWQRDDAAYFATSGDSYRVRPCHEGEWTGGEQYVCLHKVSSVMRVKYAFDFTGPEGFVERLLMPTGGDAETARAILFACLRDQKPFDIHEVARVVNAMRDAGTGLAN